MSQFEFVLVFISIVVAFAVSDVLMSWGEEIRLRYRVRHYALHTAWSLLLLFIMIQVWWSLWAYQGRPAWTFTEYAFLVLPFLTLALMAYVLTPNFDDGDVDIRQHYFDNARWVFGLGAVYLAAWTVFSQGVLANSLLEPGIGYRFIGFLLMIALATWHDQRFHAVAVTLAWALAVAWIGATAF